MKEFNRVELGRVISGGDETIVDVIGEMVRSRQPAETRVWWSRYYSDDTPTHDSPLDQLSRMADRVGNPISWLGRWSAAECLRSLGKAFKLSEPSDFPFGATGRKFALPTYFAWPLQSYPDSVANRGASLARHPRLKERAASGGVILIG